MEAFPGPTPTSPDQLASQLAHPDAKAIWSRASEVFGDENKVRSWMETPREIFGRRSPAQIAASGDAAAQRTVLEVLIRIDYGVVS